jgi:hypothetical protein
MATGERVRNAYATYLLLENSQEKFWLMLYTLFNSHEFLRKAPAVKDGHASY